MKRLIRTLTAAALAVAAGLVVGCGDGDHASRVETGQSATVFGGQVSTWALLGPSRQAAGDPVVQQVGVNLDRAVYANAPNDAAPGAGPSGAHATLLFPEEVRNETFFDHFELHWGPQGHPGPGYDVPHFDLHFYHQTAAEVAAIDGSDTTQPTAERVPAGYALDVNPATGEPIIVPQMGQHASPLEHLQNPHDLGAVLIAGFYGGRMTFLEPMIGRDTLLAGTPFTATFTPPVELGLTTRIPTRVDGSFDAASQQYRVVFSEFVTTPR